MGRAFVGAVIRLLRREPETPRLMFKAAMAACFGSVKLSLRDLCILMILVSDNTATNILIDLIGMENVNRTMESLGCGETRLRRRMMDLNARAQGRENISTPADAARLMGIIYGGGFISRAVCDEILGILSKPKKSAIRAGLPASVLVSSKPGGITGVATEWAIVYLKARPYAVAVMENVGPNGKPKVSIREISAVLFQHFNMLTHPTAMPSTRIQ